MIVDNVNMAYKDICISRVIKSGLLGAIGGGEQRHGLIPSSDGGVGC